MSVKILCNKSDLKMKIRELREISLRAIVSNFEKYSDELQDPNCRISGKPREYLKRFLCGTIFKRLKLKKKLKIKYLAVLINHYIKEINTVGISDKSLLPHILEKLQEYGESVVSFKVSAHDIEESWWQPLMASLPNVESLHIRFTPIHRSSSILPICEAIARNCPNLKVIKFCQLLTFSNDHYDGISLLLKHCQHLETVQYPDTVGVLFMMHADDLLSMRKEGLSTFKDCKKYALTGLSSKIGEHERYLVNDALQACTFVCPYVTQLTVEKLVDDTVLDLISHFSLLEHLRIDIIYPGITKSHFNDFLKLTGSKLKSLIIQYSKCVSIVTLIESCPRLQSLQLNDVGSSALRENCGELPCKASLLSLKTLFALGNFKDEATVNDLKLLISSARNIKKLRLGCFGLTNEFIRSLDLYHISELDFSFTDIHVDPLKELFLHGSLQTLNISYCRNISKADYFSLLNCLSNEQKNIVNIKCGLK